MAALSDTLAAGQHAAGFFSYELGYVLEPRLAPLLPSKRSVPLLWFGVYNEPREMTGAEVQGWLTKEAIGNPTLGALAHTWDAASYIERFEEVQNKIRAGDIYQLNLTFKAKFNLQGSPLALYRDLRLKQRVAYGGLVDTGASNHPVVVAGTLHRAGWPRNRNPADERHRAARRNAVGR